MDKMSFNPVNMLISLVFGWFVMSFLQTAVRSLVAGDFGAYVDRALAAALFRDGTGVIINVVAIVVLGAVGTALYMKLRK